MPVTTNLTPIEPLPIDPRAEVVLNVPLNGSPAQIRHLQRAIFHLWKAGVELPFSISAESLNLEVADTTNRIKAYVTKLLTVVEATK